MCTINMTFEVPESKHIDIEALKRKINAIVQVIITMPNIEKVEAKEVKEQATTLSEDVAWFKNHPVVLSADDMDERTKYILER